VAQTHKLVKETKATRQTTGVLGFNERNSEAHRRKEMTPLFCSACLEKIMSDPPEKADEKCPDCGINEKRQEQRRKEERKGHRSSFLSASSNLSLISCNCSVVRYTVRISTISPDLIFSSSFFFERRVL